MACLWADRTADQKAGHLAVSWADDSVFSRAALWVNCLVGLMADRLVCSMAASKVSLWVDQTVEMRVECSDACSAARLACLRAASKDDHSAGH